MRPFKWLVGLTGAVFGVLVFGWICSILVKPNAEWFVSLDKPSFMPNNTQFSIFWALTYGLLVYVMARLIVERRFFPELFFVMLTLLLETILCAVLFRFCNLPLSFVILIVLVIMHYLLAADLFLKRPLDGLIFLPVAVWMSFLFILVTAILF